MDLRGLENHHVEGRDNGTWVIADYYHVIVHIFSREAREFYNLDKLYGDAPEAPANERGISII
jgi:ribosome-associated protein